MSLYASTGVTRRSPRCWSKSFRVYFKKSILCLQCFKVLRVGEVILRHSGRDYLMISRAKLIPVVLGGIATLEILETKWVLPKYRPGPAPRLSLMSPVERG